MGQPQPHVSPPSLVRGDPGHAQHQRAHTDTNYVRLQAPSHDPLLRAGAPVARGDGGGRLRRRGRRWWRCACRAPCSCGVCAANIHRPSALSYLPPVPLDSVPQDPEAVADTAFLLCRAERPFAGQHQPHVSPPSLVRGEAHGEGGLLLTSRDHWSLLMPPTFVPPLLLCRLRPLQASPLPPPSSKPGRAPLHQGGEDSSSRRTTTREGSPRDASAASS